MNTPPPLVQSSFFMCPDLSSEGDMTDVLCSIAVCSKKDRDLVDFQQGACADPIVCLTDVSCKSLCVQRLLSANQLREIRRQLSDSTSSLYRDIHQRVSNEHIVTSSGQAIKTSVQHETDSMRLSISIHIPTNGGAHMEITHVQERIYTSVGGDGHPVTLMSLSALKEMLSNPEHILTETDKARVRSLSIMI